MVNVKEKKCRNEGCGKIAAFGVAGTKTAEYCKQHAPDGMVNNKRRMCGTEACGKFAGFGVAGTKTREYCKQHAAGGVVNVKEKKCRNESCGKIAAFGVAGTKTAEYCTQHAPDGMINVRYRMCRTTGCSKRPSFGVAVTNTVEYCKQHAPYGMVNVHRKRRTEDSGTISALKVADTKTDEQCAQHNMSRCGVEGCRRKWIGPNHSGKETIGDASPIGSKHETVHSPTALASPLSGGNRVSRKRVQHPHNMPTALKRAVILESVAGAVTMPEIEGQKSPVKRDSSVKTEVQLSF